MARAKAGKGVRSGVSYCKVPGKACNSRTSLI